MCNISVCMHACVPGTSGRVGQWVGRWWGVLVRNLYVPRARLSKGLALRTHYYYYSVDTQVKPQGWQDMNE